MKLLFDENLSPSLVHRLADLFSDSAHVHNLGLGQADDATISAFARDLRLTFGNHASRVAWIRSGNGTTNVIETILRSRALALEALADDETGVIDIL